VNFDLRTQPRLCFAPAIPLHPLFNPLQLRQRVPSAAKLVHSFLASSASYAFHNTDSLTTRRGINIRYAMSLFGNVGQTERKTGTLFGSTIAPPGGLFGQSQQSTSQPAPSLFGASAAPQQQQSTGLFGQSAAQPQQTGGLFGSTAAPQQQQQQNASLFGASQQQQQQNTGSLFTQSQLQQQPQVQQQPNFNNSLFGGKLQPAPALNPVQAQQLQQQQQALPQLRQSLDKPFASSSLQGQSMYPA
jgi:nuclear pore complex protein Nup54